LKASGMPVGFNSDHPGGAGLFNVCGGAHCPRFHT